MKSGASGKRSITDIKAAAAQFPCQNRKSWNETILPLGLARRARVASPPSPSKTPELKPVAPAAVCRLQIQLSYYWLRNSATPEQLMGIRRMLLAIYRHASV